MVKAEAQLLQRLLLPELLGDRLPELVATEVQLLQRLPLPELLGDRLAELVDVEVPVLQRLLLPGLLGDSLAELVDAEVQPRALDLNSRPGGGLRDVPDWEVLVLMFVFLALWCLS